MLGLLFSAIAMASTLLETGYADVMIAGGYDAICEYVYAGFNSLRLVASGPVRPFSKDRQGMKVAEGYALLVLERQGERAAKPIAQIAGYGESSDVHHLTQPHPKGDGAARAIRAALDDAQLQTTDIDFISAHATSTPDNDRGEFAAFNQTFQEHLPNISVAGFKANVGHTLGAAGACELLFASSALNEQLVPPTPNVEADRVEFDALQINTGDSAIEQPITHTLNTSLGFGGSNSCMILSRPRTGNGQRSELQEVVITGIGLISALGETTDAFLDRAFDDSAAPITEDTDPIDPSKYIGLINARRARRLSDYVKLTLAATTLAYRSAGIEDIAAFGETCHGMLGTAHGSTGYCQQYYRQIVDEGVDAGNPLLFAEGVPNSAAAHLSMTMSIKGLCQTVIGMRTAGIDAVALAAQRIASGRWQRAVVGAAEEFSPVANNAYRQCGSLRGNAFASGSAALILESQSSANSAGRSALGRIVSSQSRANLTNDATALEDMWNELNKPTHVVSAANDGHIEDVFVRPGCSHHSIYGHQPESFSVSPLIALATVLRRGRMPDDKATMDDFAVVSSDPIGAVSALRVQRVT
jgi:3-oxoacyl-[acyl-carrier-protein] synthase II